MLLPFTDFRAQYRVATPVRLPHHCGSLLRGVLGRSLRRAGCARTDSPCVNECAEADTCAYSRLFDPPVPDPLPHKLLRGSTRVPPPLLPLIPQPGSAELDVDERLTLELRVLGRLDPAGEDRLREAFEHLASFPLGPRQGRVALEEVAIVGERDSVATLEAPVTSYRQAVVSFETPVWVETKGRLPRSLEPAVLVRAIYRRLCTLCALYGELDPADDARVSRLDELARALTVARHALRPLQWERHSLERNRRHPMRGLWGTLELHGELSELAGVLRLAEVAHVGKATSHGLGRIRVALA